MKEALSMHLCWSSLFLDNQRSKQERHATDGTTTGFAGLRTTCFFKPRCFEASYFAAVSFCDRYRALGETTRKPYINQFIKQPCSEASNTGATGQAASERPHWLLERKLLRDELRLTSNDLRHVCSI